MTRKVYVVTEGAYSSYGIERVFSNREAAESFCESWNAVHGEHGQVNEIEVYDLLDSDPGMWEEHRVHMSLNGPGVGGWEDLGSGEGSSSQWKVGPPPSRCSVQILGNPYLHPDTDLWRREGRVGQVSVTVLGTGPDIEQVRHATRERAMQVKAEWPIYQAQARERVRSE